MSGSNAGLQWRDDQNTTPLADRAQDCEELLCFNNSGATINVGEVVLMHTTSTTFPLGREVIKSPVAALGANALRIRGVALEESANGTECRVAVKGYVYVECDVGVAQWDPLTTSATTAGHAGAGDQVSGASPLANGSHLNFAIACEAVSATIAGQALCRLLLAE